jgi:hypothetical protein
MLVVNRKPIVFKNVVYSPGEHVPGGLLDQYQLETFKRIGFVTEVSDPEPAVKPKRSLKDKADMVEVKPLEAVEV